jgi:transposase InsO family protein
MGRPPHSQQEIEQAKPVLLSILRTVGYRAGKGTMEIKLPKMPRRVISTALQVIKAEHRAREARRWEENRVHVEVLARGVLLTQDSTHIGDFKGRKAWAEVNKDAASTMSWANGDGKPITGDAMLEHLEHLWSQGLLPLVLATDNGSAYKDHRVALCLHKWQVIHLFSRPHTPQDNGRAECGIGEGKARAGLGKGVQLQSPVKGVLKLDKALQTLNRHWPRQTKGGLTATQLVQKLPHWRNITTRSTFYDAAYSAILAARAKPGCNQRAETREAIFRTLEQFELILRTRGELKGP